MNSKKLQFAILGILVFLPVAAFAQSSAFTPLIGIPGLTDRSGPLNFSDYINTLYALSISIAGLLAVIKIIIAGVKYMLSDVVTSKQSAIGDIKGALLGLLIVISAFLVLNVINPDLNETTLFLSPIDRATTNSSNARAGSGTGGPMPPMGTTPSGPVAVGDINCTPHPTLLNNYDCAAAIASCTAARGVQVPEGFLSNPSDITCRYGTSGPARCEHTGISYNDVGPATYDNLNCSAARTSCLATTGNIFTDPPEGSFTGSCFRPTVPSP